MKILVIGTSNTIVRNGWFDGFSDSLGVDVERIALGGAPFTQFFSVLDKVKDANPVHIILECSANDESYTQHIGNDIFVDRLYFMLLSSLRFIAPTTVLRIPPQATFKEEPGIFSRQRAISQQLDCGTYDTAPLIVEIQKQSEPYRDKHHLITEIANSIGRKFAQYLAPHLNASRTPANDLANFAGAVSELSVEDKGLETTQISTSLLQEEFPLLKPGNSKQFKKGVFAIGFYINAGRSTGVLRLDGSTESQDIFCFYNNQSNSNVKRFVPLRNGMNLKKISCVYAHKSINVSLHTDLFKIQQEVSLGRILCLDLNSSTLAKAG